MIILLEGIVIIDIGGVEGTITIDEGIHMYSFRLNHDNAHIAS